MSIAEDLKVRGLTQNDKTDDDVIEEPAGNARQFLQRKRQRSEDEDDEVIMTDSTPGKRPPLPFQGTNRTNKLHKLNTVFIWVLRGRII